MVRLLHERGAKLDVRGKNGQTALSRAVQYGRTPDLALWLLDQGVDAGGTYPFKNSRLTLAELLAVNKRMKDSPKKAELARRLGAN